MRFVDHSAVVQRLRRKSVAIVGSGPGCLDNEPGFVDAHEVVVRVNNYKTGLQQGMRCDVFYSFFGASIRKQAADLVRDGVTLCMAKCPDAKPIESPWHEERGKQTGIDFRYIYDLRKDWWFCDTYVPSAERFISHFELLGKHIPTTGFAAILDVLDCAPREVYLTGFDFFTSGVHNVDEPHRMKNSDDPIGHRPELEAQWLRAQGAPLRFDRTMSRLLA